MRHPTWEDGEAGMNAGKRYDGTPNLKPCRSKDEARERGQKGGQASGEARREKRAMREMASLVLGAPVPVSKDLEKQLQKLGFDVTDANIQLLSLLSVAKNATKGDLAALAFLRDTAGEKPADKVDVNQTVTGDFVLEIEGEDDAGDGDEDDAGDEDEGAED